MNGLHIENLTVAYGRKTVLTDVNLQAQPGEILAILGENGSGKTTLLRAVQGSLPLRQGRIRIGPTDLAGCTARGRAALVTTMNQDIPAGDGMSGMERAELGLFARKGVLAAVTEQERGYIRETAEKLGAAHLLDRPMSAMSTGERQMISLLRAAVQDTPVLLLDEPASALDFGRTEELYFLMEKLAEQGKILLLVTHDPTAALRRCHRVFLMERLEEGNTLSELPDVRRTDSALLQERLQCLYPHLRIHSQPLFCYTDPNEGVAYDTN